MRVVFKNLYCGKEIDFDIKRINFGTISTEISTPQVHGWAIVHAAKEPYHRQFVGYATRGCPKDSPEYLWAERGNHLALNMVDAPRPEFFDKSMIDKALEFIDQKLNEGFKVLVHCNQGESRAPSLCLLYLIKHGIIRGDTLEGCETEFMKLYPGYNPGAGMRGFVKEHFADYQYATERYIPYESVSSGMGDIILQKVNGTKEKEYEIWSEGYFTSGMEGIPSGAVREGRFKGYSFLDACINAGIKVELILDENDNLLRIRDSFGCNLFDNEADARKTYG